MQTDFSPRWAALLASAVTTPGFLHSAYRRFHGYSLGNQFAALVQCHVRCLEPGPIATLQRWNALGRSVRKGEHALVLCMPVTVRAATSDDPCDNGAPRLRTVFIWKPRWFVLAQTDGAPFEDTLAVPAWDSARALATLAIDRVPFQHPDGNVQGYARERTVAVSPLAALPMKTLFHELGHVLLHHTAGLDPDRDEVPRTLAEAEAEAVALLCLEALQLPGIEFARGYIQSWLGPGQSFPERSAQRVFKAADTILRAGSAAARPEAEAAA